MSKYKRYIKRLEALNIDFETNKAVGLLLYELKKIIQSKPRCADIWLKRFEKISKAYDFLGNVIKLEKLSNVERYSELALLLKDISIESEKHNYHFNVKLQEKVQQILEELEHLDNVIFK